MTHEEERKSVIWPCVTINPCTTPQQKATGAYTHTAESESAGYWSNQYTPFHVCSSLCTHCQHLQRSFMFAWQIYTWKELKHKLTRQIKHSSEYTWYLKLCAVHVLYVHSLIRHFEIQWYLIITYQHALLLPFLFTFIYATMPSRVPDRTIKNLVVKVVDPQLENDNFFLI